MKYSEYLEQLAMETGLRLDAEHRVLTGNRSGYNVTVSANPQAKYQFFISVPVSRNGQKPDAKELKPVAKANRQIAMCGAVDYTANFVVRATGGKTKSAQNTKEALDIAVNFLRENGYVPCCQACGEAVEETQKYILAGEVRHLCANCAGKVETAAYQVQQKEQMTSENVLAGIVGALLGSVLGGAVIVILSRLGYVAALSGIVMAICTLKGYELLGRKMSTKGIVICCAIMLVMVFVADRIDWGIVIAQELEVDVFTGFRILPTLISEGMLSAADYIKSLAMVYVFAIGGAAWQIAAYVKNWKKQNTVAKI